MIITKTKFLNYTRCNKYVELEKVYNDRVNNKLSLEDYKLELENEKVLEILSSMFKINDDEETFKLNKEDIQLEALMNYYKEIEVLAGDIFTNKFGGNTISSLDTKNQKMLEFDTDENKYLCYVDIYNEKDDEVNIIEVKATTSRKYLDIKYELEDLFKKNKDGIYEINYPSDLTDKFSLKYNKLKDRYDNCGKYIYDLAVQRYFNEQTKSNKKTNYLLAVLSHEYIYDGKVVDGKRVYDTDINGNDIIVFFNLNQLTEELLTIIDEKRKELEENIKSVASNKVVFGKHCMLGSNTECIYKDICYKLLPKTNTSYNFLFFKHFEDEKGNKYNKYDLLNNGIYKMEDVPREWIDKPNHIIQYDSLINKKEYINKDKIRDILNHIEYPIYHLDFEAFPCPLPRFKGEKCYTQSVFEFSLHIEKEPGICDEIKDNIIFLADTFEDERKLLIESILKNIDPSKGTMLAQNISYEKARLKELAEVFPEYKTELLNICDIGFDLLDIIRNNSDYYQSIGYSSKDSKVINYYHYKLSGSYSIKKTLPLFVPNLSYDKLGIKNGTEALVEYSKYNTVSKSELKKIKDNLVIYCRQDTRAMVEILRSVREKVKNS